MIHMHAGDGLPRAGSIVGGARDAAAGRVVENEHAVGAGGVFQRARDLRVVDGLYFLVVVEVLHPGLVADQLEALVVQRD
jgi:hypothetical protein